MLSDEELRRAVFALRIVDERGDYDVLRALIRDATRHIVTEDPRDGMSPNGSFRVFAEAEELTKLLLSRKHQAMQERCEQAILEADGYCRQRLAWQALIDYATHLIGQCVELTGGPSYAEIRGISQACDAMQVSPPRSSIEIVAGDAV
jgi:hypothetical protein